MQYKITSKLAQGTFTSVYAASEVGSGRKVVVKMTDKNQPHLEGIPNPLAFENEGRILELLRQSPHPNIAAQLHSYGTNPDAKHFVSVEEYCGGGDLLGFVERKKNTFTSNHSQEESLKKLFLGVAQGVGHLHSLGVIHRDMKLENVLIGEDAQPKLTDFNLSCMAGEAEIEKFCGSLPYCSPEMLTNRTLVSAATDVWALGVVMYATFFHYFPFAFPSGTTDPHIAMTQYVNMVVQARLRFPELEEKRVSEAAVDLMRRMMTVEISERITMEEMQAHPWFDSLKAPPVVVCEKEEEVFFYPPSHSLPTVDECFTEKTEQFKAPEAAKKSAERSHKRTSLLWRSSCLVKLMMKKIR